MKLFIQVILSFFMRILHTSDWHLGRQFHHRSLLDDQTFILQQILTIAKQQQIDVILIAGDIFDRAIPPAEAVKLLDDFFYAAQTELEVPVILISGNHDSGQRLAFGARQLTNSGIHIHALLAPQPQMTLLHDEYGDVAFYAIPYADPAMVRDVLGVDVHSYEEASQVLTQQIIQHNKAGRRTVVLGHCFLDGGESSESERPLSVGGADQISAQQFATFDYVALGHLHGPQNRLKEHIRYSGSPLKYSFSEQQHKKSVTIVDLDANGKCAIEMVPLKAKRDMRVIEGHLEQILEEGKNDPNQEDYVMVRLLDKHAILDVMGKIREIYPHVLHIERPSLMQGGERRQNSREHLSRGELPLFKDFYQQMTGEEIEPEMNDLVAKILDQVHREES